MGKKLRAVLVGCGGICHAWLGAPALQEMAEVVGLVDLREESARKVAEQFSCANAAIGTDLETLLAATQPDVVFDCTIPEAHHAVTRTALQAGCHVLGEKPLADTMAHARAMVAAAAQANKLYAVIQNRRYLPGIRRLRAFLDTGAIGRVTTVQSNFFIGADFGRDNFRAAMPHVLLLDMAIHTFDAARLIMGANPVRVLAQEWNPSGSWYDRDAAAVACFQMTGDIRYIYHGSWCARGQQTTWEADWLIRGELGSVQWDGASAFRALVMKNDEQPRWPGDADGYDEVDVPEVAGAAEGGHDGVIREFLTCVRDGGTPETIASDNIFSLAMVHAAIASAEQQMPVTITPEGVPA